MMQTKAEEKKKGYCCVVWVERAITVEDLRRVEELSRSGEARDEAGEACIVVSGHFLFVDCTAGVAWVLLVDVGHNVTCDPWQHSLCVL